MFCLQWVCQWSVPVPRSVSHLADGQLEKKSPVLVMRLRESRSEPKTRANMRLPRQLEFAWGSRAVAGTGDPGLEITPPACRLAVAASLVEVPRFAQRSDYRTSALETTARELLRSLGANRIAAQIRVEWNPRLETAAGRADFRQKLISLNPRLAAHPEEIDRTLRHELAHFLAQFRAGRRRISPHGSEWQQACVDLRIPGEKRCHTLPFPAKRCAPRFIYRCPNCLRDFPRVRKIRRAVACLVCCRVHNGGAFDARFQLRATKL
jgi:predicted SprT family Zn-dependent metalloprotease